MQTDIESNLQALRESVGEFNYIMHLFLNRISEQSQEYAQRFMKFKKTKNKNMEDFPQKDLSLSDEFGNKVFEEALKHRFNSCYPETISFLQQYLQTTFSIDVDTPQEALEACLDKNIITQEESKNLLTLSQDQAFLASLDEPGVDMYMIDYGVCMHNILKRLNN